MKPRWFPSRLLLLTALLFFHFFAAGPGRAWGHGVWVFAYESGDEIVIEGSVGNNHPVVGGKVRVYRSGESAPLMSGKTGADGRCRLPRPPGFAPGDELRIVLDAGSGHRAQWLLKAETDPPTAAGGQAGEERPRDSGDGGNRAAAFGRKPVSPVLDEERMKELVARAVAREMEPLKRMMLESRRQRPGLTEIIGGIGWLVGLAGLVSWLRNRKNRH